MSLHQQAVMTTPDEQPVHQLPSECMSTAYGPKRDVLVDKVLLACIEFLESENERLKKEKQVVGSHFRVEQIKHDDKLVHFYTGFISFVLYLAFFSFLGDVVEHLNYWGSKDTKTKSQTEPNEPTLSNIN